MTSSGEESLSILMYFGAARRVNDSYRAADAGFLEQQYERNLARTRILAQRRFFRSVAEKTKKQIPAGCGIICAGGSAARPRRPLNPERRMYLDMTKPAVLRTFLLAFCFCAFFSQGYSQNDPNAQYILFQKDELRAGFKEIEVPIEVGVWKLQYNLQPETPIDEKLAWQILTPSGAPLSLSDPNISVSETRENRQILIWDPRPGLWKIRLTGAGGYSLTTTAQGELHICCLQLWGRNGVFGADRLPLAPGQRLQGQVYVSGFNIESIRFDMVNEQGEILAPLKFRQSDYSNPNNFTLLIDPPKIPFRALARGRDTYGKNFQRVFYPLFNPKPADPTTARTEGATSGQPITMPPEWNQTMVEGDYKIVRAQVLKWEDENLQTEQGAPIGIRLKYSMEFPADGSYSPQPQVYPERLAAGYTGALIMRVIRGTVAPLPEGLQNQTQFFLGARAQFKAGVVYQFTVDVVPGYAAFNPQKESFCLALKSYGLPNARERFNREIMSEDRLRYRVSFAGTNLDGRTPVYTENSYTPANWYRGLLKLGAVECP